MDTDVTRTAAEPRDGDKLYKWLALGVLVIGTFNAILNSSIVNVAIPKMMTVFGVSTTQIQWVVTAYMLTMGSVIPLTGYLADRFGTKKLYIWSVVIFTIGSACCGVAWSSSTMVFSRVIQGLGAGMIMPISMAMVFQMFPVRERGTAIGVFGIATMAAPAIGPTLSGYIVEFMNWRLIFTINIPLGILAVLLAIFLLREGQTRPVGKFDIPGFLTSTLGLVSVLYILGEGTSLDWGDFKNVFITMFGVFSLIVFVIIQLTREDPLLDLRIFRYGAFSLSIIISSVLNIALFGGIFLIPLYLQNLQSLSAMQTGLILLPAAMASGVMMPISGKLFDLFGSKIVVIPGLILVVWASYGLTKIDLDTSISTITWLMIWRGFGMGLSMMPSQTVGMNVIPPHLIAQASAVSNVVRQVAAAMGLTLLTTVMQHQQAVSYAGLSQHINVFNYAATQAMAGIQGLYSANGYPAEAAGAAIATLYALVQKQAAMLALNDTFVVALLIATLTIPLAFFLPNKGVVADSSEGETKATPPDNNKPGGLLDNGPPRF